MASQQLFGPSSYKETIHDSIPISFQIGEGFSVRFNEVPLFINYRVDVKIPMHVYFGMLVTKRFVISCNFIIIAR